MGATSNFKMISNLPKSGIYSIEEEKEKMVKGGLGVVNFKELMMEGLSKEFLTLFKENRHLFYSQSFLEGISFEYGLFDKSMNKNKAFKIYKEGADLKNDYLCMYRMHRIFLVDYKDFELERNTDLDKLYLYKCLAYLPYMIIDRTYFLLNKIDVVYEIALCLDEEDSNLDKFNKFLEFLEKYKDLFHLSLNDILLMNYVINAVFHEDKIKNNITDLDNFLNLIKGDDAYYEGQLKYCNFYLKFAEEEYDKEEIKNIFDNLVKAEYYKAYFDYGLFLMEEGKFDQARSIFKKGADKAQQFCLCEYIYVILRENDLNQILSDYKITSYILKNICLTICIEKLGISSFIYFIYYLLKHSSYKKKIENYFIKYAFECIEIKGQICQVDNQFIENNFDEKHIIEIYRLYGNSLYYGINYNLKSNKEKAILYFKKSYNLAKEREYNYLMRSNYLYIYKCRKYLFKNNKITKRKLNKTKEKLFMMYENTDIADLNSVEIYNYYKLYKSSVSGNITDKIISLLKAGKNIKIFYNSKLFVYKEKCKKKLEEEYANSSNYNENKNNLIMKRDEFEMKNTINIYFSTMVSNYRYKLTVSKDLQFIKAIHKLFNNYPELEEKKISCFISQGDIINLFDTIEENKLNENSLILMIDKQK